MVNGVKKAWGEHHKSNQDLWSEAKDILLTRPGKVVVEKVKCHTTEADIKAGRSTQRKKDLNDAADEQAGIAARTAQLPPNVVDKVLEVTRKCELVQGMLVQIATTLFQEKRILLDRPILVPMVLKVGKQWERKLAKRMLNSSHRAARTGLRGCKVVCTESHRKGTARKAGRWLVSLCPAVADADPTLALERGVHRSHLFSKKTGFESAVAADISR